jgi:peptidoglycan/LPS O-acetylase OafA/YrhL
VTVALVRTFRPKAWAATVAARPNLILVGGAIGVGVSILVFGAQTTGFWRAILGYPLLSMSMAALVAAGSETGSWIGRRAVPGAGALAAASYSIYLTHKMAYHAVIRLTQGAGWPAEAKLAVAIVAALAVGAALYLRVERPFLKLRDRLRDPARPALQPAA